MSTSLHDFFQKMYDFLEPRATRVFRDNLDAGLTCNDDEDVVDIPTF